MGKAKVREVRELKLDGRRLEWRASKVVELWRVKLLVW